MQATRSSGRAHLNATGAVTLRGGRRVTYLAAGSPGGFPVLYFHGAIGSPMRRSPGLEAVIARHRLRYLMVNRPGFGGSDPEPNGDIASRAGDVAELADTLGLERFSIVGVSAGAPYALACAARIPERLHRVAVVSSTAPGLPPHAATGMARRYRLALAAMARRPELTRRLGDRAVGAAQRHPDRVEAVLRRAGGRRGDLADPQARRTAVNSLLAATERGVGPMIADYLVGCRPWGFEPAEVEMPVQLWHGGRDRIAPLAGALSLARRMPRCRAHVDDREGHFFYGRRIEAILTPLAGAMPHARPRAA